MQKFLFINSFIPRTTLLRKTQHYFALNQRKDWTVSFSVAWLHILDYSRKYPHTPLWKTLNWIPRNFRISKKGNCSFCRIPEPADSKSWGVPEFCKNLNGFPGIPVKIYKIGWKFEDFRSYSLSISYRISNVVHGCVWIFSGIAHYDCHMNILSQLRHNWCLRKQTYT